MQIYYDTFSSVKCRHPEDELDEEEEEDNEDDEDDDGAEDDATC
jgi:hypothetical protein